MLFGLREQDQVRISGLPSSLFYLHSFFFFCLFFCSEAAKVTAEETDIKGSESEKKKEYGDVPSPTTASLSTQSAALTQ